MILCVAEIRNPNIMELSDGWYSIDAHCDQALMQLVEKKKIFVGVKLAISGAELGSPGPSSPLEKGPDTYLKVCAACRQNKRQSLKLTGYSKYRYRPTQRAERVGIQNWDFTLARYRSQSN